MVTWDLPAGSGAAWANDYDRGRPGWPADAASVTGLSMESVVLDLAAGSGKLTAILTKRFSTVIAVEPQAALRAILEERATGAEVRDGTADDLPLANATVDAVFVAQAFHWFANPTAIVEIARVMRPRGMLVLMWNLPKGPWLPSATEAERVLLGRAPRANDDDLDPLDFSVAHATEWRSVVEASPFGPIHHARLSNPQTVSAEGLTAYFASMGWIAELPNDERLPLLAEVREALNADWYRREWETLLFWMRLGTAL